MHPASCHALILLSVPETSASLDQIIGVADAINHAIPTHAELADSLGFLIGVDLVAKADQRYSLTSLGVALLARARNPPPASVFELWHRLEPELLKSAQVSYLPDTLTAAQVSDALNVFRKRFQAQYGRLTTGEA
jgi:predicted transcriptional regulator